MESVLRRHGSLVVLGVVLFAQILGLAVQVKRAGESGSVRLVRLWAVSVITPAEKAVVYGYDSVHGLWRNYILLRGIRAENRRLRDENAQLRLERVRMAQDAGQAQRLQALLKFKEEFIAETVAAQVIGGSGSEQSRLLYLDKGSDDGLKPDMAVIVPAGVVGKILHVFPTTSQVLEINDQSSGVGAILEKSRLHGIVKGTPAGEILMTYVMNDETVAPGERVLTSGGDRVFPKGLPIGVVTQVSPGSDVFLNIRVKPAASLSRVEEVLVITKVATQPVEAVAEGPVRAIDILAGRLPTVPPNPPGAGAQGASGAAAQGRTAPATQTVVPDGGNGSTQSSGTQAASPTPARTAPAATPSQNAPSPKPAPGHVGNNAANGSDQPEKKPPAPVTPAARPKADSATPQDAPHQ